MRVPLSWLAEYAALGTPLPEPGDVMEPPKQPPRSFLTALKQLTLLPPVLPRTPSAPKNICSPSPATNYSPGALG